MATRRIFLDGKTASPEDYYEYFNDFTNTAGYAAADWTITTTEGGTGAATEAISAALSTGVLVITNDDASGDADFLQNKLEAFKFVPGKKLYAAIRMKLNDVTLSDFVFGLQITDTSPLAVTNGLWFGSDSGDALLDLHVAKASAQSNATGIATLVNDTWVKLAIYYDGGDKIQAYVDDVGVGSVPVTNAPNTEELAISFGVQNGEAVVKVLSIDFIRVVVER